MMAEESDKILQTLHKELIDQLKAKGYFPSHRVEVAFRAVPRHLFLPEVAPQEVYQDKAIITKTVDGRFVSSSSQPTIMAIMLEQLDLHKGQRVLEIGAGTGYNAALMAHIVGETGQVITIDIDEDIVENARKHLAVAGYERVQVICADGGLGFPDAAPYDRIILTVNAGDITPAWNEQLAENGRLLLPLSVRGPQIAVAFKRVDTHFESVSVQPCGFVGLRGVFAEQGQQVQLSSEEGLVYLTLGEQTEVDTERVMQWLYAPPSDRTTSVSARIQELFSNLTFWVALHEPGFCNLTLQHTAIERGIVPNLFPMFGDIPTYNVIGVLSQHALSLLTYAATDIKSLGSDGKPQISALPLQVRTFGDDADLPQHLVSLLESWQKEGRPNEQRLKVRAYPRGQAFTSLSQDILLERPWTHFLFSW
jgi:protein-L-isoaspartate(D-aspartate) O-methyltransferase